MSKKYSAIIKPNLTMTRLRHGFLFGEFFEKEASEAAEATPKSLPP